MNIPVISQDRSISAQGRYGDQSNTKAIQTEEWRKTITTGPQLRSFFTKISWLNIYQAHIHFILFIYILWSVSRVINAAHLPQRWLTSIGIAVYGHGTEQSLLDLERIDLMILALLVPKLKAAVFVSHRTWSLTVPENYSYKVWQILLTSEYKTVHNKKQLILCFIYLIFLNIITNKKWFISLKQSFSTSFWTR